MTRGPFFQSFNLIPVLNVFENIEFPLLLVTAVAIFINLRMSVNDRMREIGTMRTIVIVLFKYGVAIPPKGAFSLLLERGHIVFLPHATDLLFVFLAIGFFAALFSFIPARQAGRIRPVEALTRLE